MTLKETRRLLLDLYDRYPPRVLARMAGRSVGTIRNMASAMGLRAGGRGPKYAPEFTDRETRIIRRWYGHVPAVQLAYELDRTVAAIHAKAQRLGVQARRLRRWTDEEDDLLRRRYPAEGSAAVAMLLKRSRNAIIHRARSLGVRREPYVHPWSAAAQCPPTARPGPPTPAHRPPT